MAWPTRLDTSAARFTVNGTPYTVTGNSYLDHDQSTSSLSKKCRRLGLVFQPASNLC
jgi:hypothetical protein